MFFNFNWFSHFAGELMTFSDRKLCNNKFTWCFHKVKLVLYSPCKRTKNLLSESLYESFLNSHVLVKREEELHKSWWKLTSESLCVSFFNSHVLVKREQPFWRTTVDIPASCMVLRRCAITNTVRPSVNWSNASWTTLSDSASSALRRKIIVSK